ncbi:ribosome small subunit-dependent GTPase A [Flavimaricola marinus]|uniref:Small ribosomal subunit biogenesis GTPase RsgA n=1 Tax=Flavimaricola marinus TaxID=1819565 RepID=A0A238LBF9_9RHOB|nr:ribosome small subunit-dependent GTPase A [Flavimaricola marinus]SMY06744.1 Putative ribosome biogenesis GTPase RsgA [Flavimaricola marinus]
MTEYLLNDLGWSDHFARQCDPEDSDTPARLLEVMRDHVIGLTETGQVSLVTPDSTGLYAVGDWVLHDGTKVSKRLDRQTEIARRAAGPQAARQLIAANVDTLAIVTSCNDDFNVARLERYLAMATQAGCLPLVVLTKADQSDDPESYAKAAARLSPLLTAITLNAKDTEDADRLAPWCGAGQTLALVGSSGVGKTTLQNHLTGITALTQDIREDDAKGRHTTTARALRPTRAGGWLIDTPGMRELALSDAAEGIEAVFADVTDLIPQCRFNDCAHESEPGCAVQAAIADGTLDPGRLERWKKLMREDQFNSESVAEARARFRKLGKMYKGGKARAKAKRGDGLPD